MNGITNRYVTDDPAAGGTGWLVLEVRDGTGGVMEAYTHGLDLSGTLEGAGGIGGILSVTHPSATNATYFFHYDGNGNVVRLTDTSGAVATTLDYDPFGRVLASPGPYTPRYQFSTKECDGVVGVNYYGYRYYSPELGRWINRDAIEEQGGYYLYGFLGNTPMNSVDPSGLWWGSRDYDREENDGSVTRVVKECNIVIYVGDASLMPNIGNEPCSAASTVSCDPSVYRSGGPITIETPLPGWQPIRQPPENIGKPIHAYEGVKTDDTLSPSDAAWLANRDFEVAQDYAKNTICKSKEDCCDEVEIEISCEFLNWVNRGAISGYDVCGKSTTVSCE